MQKKGRKVNYALLSFPPGFCAHSESNRYQQVYESKMGAIGPFPQANVILDDFL